jgi:hypothetical protein
VNNVKEQDKLKGLPKVVQLVVAGEKKGEPQRNLKNYFDLIR